MSSSISSSSAVARVVRSALWPHRWRCVKLLGWLVGWRVSVAVEFGALYVVLSAFVFLFTNLSSASPASAPGQPRVSAYSAFNQGGARMAGQSTTPAGAAAAVQRATRSTHTRTR